MLEGLRARGAVAAVAAVAVVAYGGCGGSSEAGETSSWLKTRNPAAAFAPLVQLHPREQSFPMSADHFLDSSGLEFVGDLCRFAEIDITAGKFSRPLIGAPVPLMDPHKLAHEPAYRSRAVADDCSFRNEVFTSAQRTRPYDNEDRPAGLRVDEGFNLDILTDRQPGKKRLAADGSLTGVPIYVHERPERVDGAAGLRLSYWILFGRGEALDPKSKKVIPHEGDWERLDVLVQKRRSGRYRPVAVEYRVSGELRPHAWEEVEKDATDRHPVVYLARGNHTPHPHTAQEEKGDRLPWKTWRQVRDVTREPWFGYGGGWGAIGYAEATSGPLGPTPFELPIDPVDPEP